MKKIVTISALLIILGCLSSFSFGQSKAISKDNKAESIYVPVKTKMDIAIEREQKKEMERAKVLEIQNKKADIYERPLLEKKAVMYRTQVKMETQMLKQEYKLEVKEAQEQHLKKEEFQKPKK